MLRVLDMASLEGDARFKRVRTQLLNAVAAPLTAAAGDSKEGKANAAALVGLLAYTSANRETGPRPPSCAARSTASSTGASRAASSAADGTSWRPGGPLRSDLSSGGRPTTRPYDDVPERTMADEESRPIGYWLKHLDGLLEQTFDHVLARNGVRRRHWQVLDTLRGGPE